MNQREAWETWEAWLAKRGPHVRDRILRFYPDGPPPPGELIRGWHPTHPDPITYMIGAESKGQIIRRHGRGRWECIETMHRVKAPRGKPLIIKIGRRAYAYRDALLQAPDMLAGFLPSTQRQKARVLAQLAARIKRDFASMSSPQEPLA